MSPGVMSGRDVHFGFMLASSEPTRTDPSLRSTIPGREIFLREPRIPTRETADSSQRFLFDATMISRISPTVIACGAQ